MTDPTNGNRTDGRTQTHEVERDDYPCIRYFPKENLIIVHYIISAWWLHLLEGLLHYVIHPGAIEQVLVITNNIITLGYTYTKIRLNISPDIFCKIAHNGRLVECILSGFD